jgi:predicted dehydrogenase
VKALVVGGGSIGRRHLKNLAALGVGPLGVVEVERETRDRVQKELGAATFTTLEEGLAWNPQFAVIATPPHLHIEQALAAAERGMDLFIEKPLTHRPEGIGQLAKLLSQHNCISLVGCNMRFHPGPAQVKRFIAEGRLGKVLFARIHAGSYLPEWRPGTDYRQNYAAKAETGGGCMLDCIHEIDLARWYLGEVEEVMACAAHLSRLEIDTEDYAFLFLRHESGAVSEVHLDYLQRSYERGCQIAGEQGTLGWDFREGKLRWYDAGRREWTEIAQPPGWTVNDMYIAEMQHFLDCVRKRTATALPVAEAARVMEVVFAAKKAARGKTAVTLAREVIA